MHFFFYTFRPPAPTVRTGTADAELWSGRPRMVREGCEGAARHRIAISTSGEHRAAAAEGASRGENRPFGQLRAHGRRADADLDVSHRNHEVADRMKVPLGIGSRSVRLRSGAALADSACEAAGPPAIG